MMNVDRESEYLRRLGEGDHDAFDTLFMAYHSPVKRFLTGFIKDEDEVLDMLQDIFCHVWEHRNTIAKVDSFKAYLFRMARNAIYNHFKINAIREEHLQQYQREAILTDDLAEERLHAEELGLLLDIAVDHMPPQRKLVFKMSRKEGLSNEEISKCLNISKRTVENHITAALSELRKLINVIIPFFI
jgi:RNA polymerase sigma-70 factor (ECF subfamily)